MAHPSYLAVLAIGALVGILCVIAAIIGGSFKTRWAEIPNKLEGGPRNLLKFAAMQRIS
jgi:hypothetical protein